MISFKIVQKLALRLYRELVRVDYTHQAASLAFATVLSTIPIILISFTILSNLPIFENIAVTIEKLILSNFLGPSANTIDQYLDTFFSHTKELPTYNVIFLFITNTFLFFNIESVLNNIWQVPKSRHTLLGFLTYCSTLVIFPIAIASGFLIHSYINVTFIYPSLSLLSKSINIMMKYIPTELTFITFFMMYKLIPNRKIKSLHALYASLFSTISFEVAKTLFTFYITYLANYSLIYGTIAALPIYMFWVYITWLILLFGAVLNYLISEYKTQK